MLGLNSYIFALQKRMGNIVDINQDVLDKIVSIIARDRVDVLKSWMNTRRAGKKAVYSPATLSSVRLDLNENFVQWSESSSTYYAFYSACLKQKQKSFCSIRCKPEIRIP